MKRFTATAIAFAILFCAIQAFATDQLITAKVGSVMEKLDKNGIPFSVVIIEETRSLNGVEYQAEVVATAFRSAHEEAKLLKPGDEVKMIANQREYNGDKSYTIRKILK